MGSVVGINQQMHLAILVWIIGIPIILVLLSILNGYVNPYSDFEDEQMYFVIIIASLFWPIVMPIIMLVNILGFCVYIFSKLGKKIRGR